MRCLGIDPGIGRVGWGVVEKDGRNMRARAWGRIDTKKNDPMPDRLATVVRAVRALVKKYGADAVAIEELFFAKNVKTALTVSQARGAIIAEVADMHIPVLEHTPLEVKQAITGYGRAEKKQVQMMLRILFKITIAHTEDDAADALAIAYTALVTQKNYSL